MKIDGNSVHLWDAFGMTKKEIGSFSNHVKTVTNIDFVQSGSKIITSSLDKFRFKLYNFKLEPLKFTIL